MKMMIQIKIIIPTTDVHSHQRDTFVMGKKVTGGRSCLNRLVNVREQVSKLIAFQSLNLPDNVEGRKQ